MANYTVNKVILSLAMAVALYLASQYHYLLFHTTAELFSIVIAACVFVIAWNARGMLNNNYLLLLGISYLFISGLDTLHTMAYKGMGIIRGFDEDNLPPQIWLVSRYLEAVSLIVAPFLLRRRLRVGVTLLAYGAVTALALLSIFRWQVFPVCFVTGVGLTPFKKFSEYVICLLLLVAMWLLYRSRSDFDPKVRWFLFASMLATIGTELCFTIYIHLYGLSNLVGHYLKIASYYFIYKAIIETGFIKPFDLLFREIKQRESLLQEANERLAVLAATDPLTGVFNRLSFSASLAKEEERFRRYGLPFSLIMLDIDHFKQINDRYGHHTGDDVLRQFARLVSGNIRQNDILARWGGEEFMILLPNNRLAEASALAEKLRRLIERQEFDQAGAVRASFGVAEFRAADTGESFIGRADHALYQAKAEGRNRVVSAGPLPDDTEFHSPIRADST